MGSVYAIARHTIIYLDDFSQKTNTLFSIYVMEIKHPSRRKAPIQNTATQNFKIFAR
jgi:hypothetical protein